MSSTYLTHNDMRMIERLLGEVAGPNLPGGFDREAAARFLISNFERKKTAEADLRLLLAARLKVLDSMARTISRAENGGGVAGRLARTEAQRHSDNDTDGMRRRAKETERRNRLI